ncbi:cysteine hydrolase family protein [Pseudomonas sp.]|uniref:cysteine hydrolase family protein n=1 Tax=Pseudomonas sp. TaxID=306 RepID=UPI0026DC083C|nr:cysteine hydrolase family protein [Pseudomonas sp.]MDO4235914.1 cysteine hydrolase family protein [Pseudomonas sp.]
MFRVSYVKGQTEPLATNAALVIIDMQKGMGNPTLGRRNNPDAERHIQQLLNAWRQAQRPIIHVRHISRSPGSVFWPGQPGCEFQDALHPLANEQVMEKNVPDAFIATGLERWLHTRSIKQLVIAGVITNNSVESTARSAGNLGFDVIVVADACFTFDQTDLSGRIWPAEDVHALSLSNLAMDYARVLETEALLA